MTMNSEMDADRWTTIKQIFEAAQSRDVADRDAFLDEACGGDSGLRAEVESLLQAHDAEGPVDRAMSEVMGSFHPESGSKDLQGHRIGPYEVINELGHGGMGRVFLARRADGQFDQQVALKLLGVGLPSADAQSRFLAERQILATLNHPNIARLLDGGVSDAGQPYFVMEVIEGAPIDQYCETHELSVRERLQLVLDVCDAVQYAHQKLVVHRDLKPSNIFVTDDGQVKLLDFGIAKLLNPDALLADEAPRTRTGLLPMTPSYASPEQVRGDSITTASDVYQLGIVLYELLTGSRPYRVEGQTPSEVERIICEEIPTRPSTAVAQTDDATEPPTSPGQLQSRLQGDLDIIVMKALRKEPERRYETVEQLADDLRRTLDGRPVSAHPDTWTYRSRKFVGRHQWGVGVAAIIVLLLAGYAATITWYSQRTQAALSQAQEEAQKSEQVTEFLVDLFRANDPSETGGETLTAKQLLERGVEQAERLDEQPEIQAEMFDVVGQVYVRLGQFDAAQDFLERSLATRDELYDHLRPDMASTKVRIASVLRKSGDYETAEARFREALDEQVELLGDEHPDVAVTQSLLAGVLRVQGDLDEAESLLRDALSIQRRHSGADPLDRAETLNILGLVLHDKTAPEEAESSLREALDLRREHLGERDPRVAMSLNNLAMVLRQNGDAEAAEPVYRDALAVKRRLYDGPHPSTASTLNGLGLALKNQGKPDAAEPVLREALQMRRSTLGPNHPRAAGTLNNLGNVLEQQGHLGEAASLLREARSLLKSAVGKAHPFVAYPTVGLGRVSLKQGRPEEAEPLLREARSIREDALPAHHPDRLEVATLLGRCLVALGRYEEAEPVLLDAHERLAARPAEGTEELLHDTLERLVELYEVWGKRDRAEKYEARLTVAKTSPQ